MKRSSFIKGLVCLPVALSAFKALPQAQKSIISDELDKDLAQDKKRDFKLKGDVKYPLTYDECVDIDEELFKQLYIAYGKRYSIFDFMEHITMCK